MTEDDVYLFDLRGYIVVRNALTAPEAASLNRAIARLPERLRGEGASHAHRGLSAVAPGGSANGSRPRTTSLLDWAPEIRDLVGHRSITGYLAALLGADFRLDHQYAVFQRSIADKAVANPLHNGAVPFNPSCYYLVRGGNIYNGMLVVSFALTDVPQGAGGFCCIPGSHKANFALPHALRSLDGPRSLARHIPLNAGDALIFTEALTHGALPWRASHERRALLFKYCVGHMQWRSIPNDAGPHSWNADQLRILRPAYAENREPSTGSKRELARARLLRYAVRARDRWREQSPANYIDHD